MTKTAYVAYLDTVHWFQVKQAALERAEWHCQLCGLRSPHMDVHHNNYDNLCHEAPADVIVLCRACHQKHHKSMNKNLVKEGL